MSFTGINKIIFEYCHHPRPYHLEYESKSDIRYDMDFRFEYFGDFGCSLYMIVMSKGKFYPLEKIIVRYINSTKGEHKHLTSRKYRQIVELFNRENQRRISFGLKINEHIFSTGYQCNSGYYGY